MIAMFSMMLKLVYLYLDPFTIWLVAGGAFMLGVVIYPSTGFIADLYVGRYRCILFGLASLWVALLTGWIGIALLIFAPTDNPAHDGLLLAYIIVACIVLLILVVGIASFMSNIIQFSTDQLPDTPNEEVAVYLHWMNFTVLLAVSLALVMTPLVQYLIDQIDHYHLWVGLMLCTATCVLIGVLLFMNCCVHHWFEGNLGGENPYSLVWKVLNFAHKHKFPVCRSALTYHEDEPPSRIDLGKGKYGGPFTTEQVEDVKTFLRLLGLIVCLGPNFIHQAILILAPTPLAPPNSTALFLVSQLFLARPTLSVLVACPLLLAIILVIHPLCWRYYPGSLKRIGLSTVFLLISLLFRFCTAVVSTVSNAPILNAWCSYHELNSTETYQCHTSWLVLVSHFFTGVAIAILYPALFTLVCAQSPRNMKGLMMGVTFSLLGLFSLLGFAIYGLVDIFRRNIDHEWIPFLISLVIGVIGLFVYVKVARWYTYRKRDELSNVRHFAERYYSSSMNVNSQATRPIVSFTDYNSLETSLSISQDTA